MNARGISRKAKMLGSGTTKLCTNERLIRSGMLGPLRAPNVAVSAPGSKDNCPSMTSMKNSVPVVRPCRSTAKLDPPSFVGQDTSLMHNVDGGPVLNRIELPPAVSMRMRSHRSCEALTSGPNVSWKVLKVSGAGSNGRTLK